MADRSSASQGYLPVGQTRLFYRTVGAGPPIIVLHGGPDFDHNYLLPELDVLSDTFRLIYHDQRGRGRSAEGVSPGQVSIRSEVDDLDSVRRHFGPASVALLGHSWGGVLAMEYATRHPDRVSRLILMNTAPASGEDAERLGQHLRRIRSRRELERMNELAHSDVFQTGGLEAEAEYYRIHFRPTVQDPARLEQIIRRLRTNFTDASVVVARTIEHRLYEQTWLTAGYDLIPALRNVDVPMLVLHGDRDFIPVELVASIAQAAPLGRLRVLAGCGHFSYLEAPDLVHHHINKLMAES